MDKSTTPLLNELGQPIGAKVTGWKGAEFPSRKVMQGQFCSVEPLSLESHLDDLYDAFSEDREGALWTYMMHGPFDSKQAFCGWLESACATEDPFFCGIVDLSSAKALGMASYLRLEPSVGGTELKQTVWVGLPAGECDT
ncbi:MAG: hypothetical protein OEM76_17275 [Gammaproteobacteria bacterium]|nr:hypothetical protein [Gammaproteobacteria bacterium]